jgi:hypothetical protein
MTLQPRIASPFSPASIEERTPLSREFESFYRALPREGHIPHRKVFRPERAAKFLRHIILCDVLTAGAPAIRMRLIGSAFEENIQRNIAGHDYLQYLPPRYHAGAVEAARHIVGRPCGLWQVVPLHYERGYGHNVELTAFPLAPGPDGVHLLLVLTQTPGGPITGTPTDGKALAVDTASRYQYIDLGAGTPE